jgi:hypothetical protein
MSPTSTPRYWFPAKRYGWGWGFPSSWQGWIVLFIYVTLVLGGIPLVRPSERTAAYVAYVSVLTAILIAICWLKGEPPRWHWGDRDA